MIGGKRRTIGLFICKTYEVFEKAVFNALEEESKARNYDIVVFTSVGYFASRNDYDTQERQMFVFAPIEQLDGILVVPDSYELEGFRDALYREVEKRADCPVVAIRHLSDRFDCVYTDESEALRPLLRHLIRDHGLKKIRFLAGYKGHPDSEIRLKTYRAEMAASGLAVDEKKDICHGNMWYNCGEAAYLGLCADPEDRPEAVVCANDYMAAGLIAKLREQGIRVPEDIIVTGFDNVPNLGQDAPMMTTVEQDFTGMVRAAMEEMDRQISAGEKYRERKARRKIGLPGRLVKGESCGCSRRDPDYYVRFAGESRRRLDLQNAREVAMTYLSIEANDVENMPQLHQVLDDKKDDTQALQDFYLCLFTEAGAPDAPEHPFARRMTDTACLVHAMLDRKDFGMPMVRFDRKRLLPPLGEREEPQVLYVMLLHQREDAYGYSVFHYLPGETPSIYFQHWNVILSNALNNIHRRNELMALYEERRLSSITDMVTDLLNRRGLLEKLRPAWPLLCVDRKQVVFISCDLDRLKQINDAFGHYAGDYAIRSIAEALRAPETGEALIARMGGDEFLTVLIGAGREEADRYIRRFEEELKAIAERDRKPFPVQASIAAEAIRLERNTTIEECISRSDEAMYEVKKGRHVTR